MTGTGAGTQYDLEPTVPAFFDSPLSIVLILWCVMIGAALWSVQQESSRIGTRGTSAWATVVIVGGPIGVLAWYLVGRRPGPPAATQGPSPFS